MEPNTLNSNSKKPTTADSPVFGVNEMRLTWRQIIVTAFVVLSVMAITPIAWKHAERFETGPNYRIPYAISADYWLYQRRADSLSQLVIPVVGDSVVWGEYVRKEGTLSHFLSQESGQQFANCGVNGVFPLALEGLVGQYGQAFSNRKVILQCNLLWLSSPKADLSIDSEETFNHTELVTQRFGAIPCYRADAATRMGAFMNTHIGFYGFVNHINTVYYGQQSLPRWTLQESDTDPPTRPNAWRNPLSPLTFQVPTEPLDDPARGPSSRRHHAWNSRGQAASHFEWVPLAKSLQWSATQRLIALLKSRGADVLVILGPFNEHMIADDQMLEYRSIKGNAASWFRSQNVALVMPDALPTELYADASHPLTDGYQLLARELAADAVFKSWLKR